MRSKNFWFLKVPKHRLRCNRWPNYPSTLLRCICVLTSSPVFVLACRLDSSFRGLFLVNFWLGPKKVLFLLPSSSRHVSWLPMIPHNPITPLTSLFPFHTPVKCQCFTFSFFYFLCYFRLWSIFFVWILLSPKLRQTRNRLALESLIRPP